MIKNYNTKQSYSNNSQTSLDLSKSDSYRNYSNELVNDASNINLDIRSFNKLKVKKK